MLKFKFELNKMQEIALEKNGTNILLNAPTGSGKTEAILVNCKNNEVYFYFLPTITSCIFMYNRLKEINIDVEIKTSVLSEKFKGTSEFKIVLMCPDQFLINYLESNENIAKNLILDELDNYPLMCQSVLLKYIQDSQNESSHIIVASATLNEELQQELSKKCFKINYDVEKKLIKHKINQISCYSEINEIINKNADKKIGIICNSIADIREIKPFINCPNLLVHHGQLDQNKRLENEKKLFNGNFNVVLSNDLISFSIDINFDILILQFSDKQSLNIQRLGRNNRTNQKVSFTNTYVIDTRCNECVPFIDFYDSYENAQQFTFSKSYNNIQDMRKNLVIEELPSIEHIFEYWENLKSFDLDLNLREVPITFKLNFIDTKKIYNKETKKYEIIEFENSRTFKANNGMPWAWDGSFSEVQLEKAQKGEDFKEDLVYFFGQTYKIIGKDNQNFIIEEYDFLQYSCFEIEEEIEKKRKK